jgi:hypothetical protein
LSAEAARANWPRWNAVARNVRTDPVANGSRLVQTWNNQSSRALRGIIWYRLPVAVDNLNWRWPTLAAIIARREPHESFHATARRVEPGLVEISLVNDGELDISSRLAVEVRWSDARLIAGDGLRDFELAEQNFPPRDSKINRRNSVCLPVKSKSSAGCGSTKTVRCSLKSKSFKRGNFSGRRHFRIRWQCLCLRPVFSKQPARCRRQRRVASARRGFSTRVGAHETGDDKSARSAAGGRPKILRPVQRG